MRIALLTGLLLAVNTADAITGITYYHNDVLGSPVLATAEDGSVLWRARYRPFGSRDQGGGEYAASLANPVWYGGHERDAETGLTYMQARYYDPVLGRFLAADPAGFTADNLHSFNRYAYANNNPYRYVDPDGRESIVFSLRGTAAAGTGVSAGTGIYLSFPGRDQVPFDAGIVSYGAAVLGADVSATANVALLAGGRDNLEGVQLTTGMTLPVTGAVGPAIDVEHIINPVTGESAGSSLGAGLTAFPTASVALGTSFVTFSLRDTLLGGSAEVGVPDPGATEAQALDQWFWHLAN